MDLEIIIRSEVSQTEEGKCHDIGYTWSLNYDAKQKQAHTLREQTHSHQRGQVGRGGRNQEYELTYPHYNIQNR